MGGWARRRLRGRGREPGAEPVESLLPARGLIRGEHGGDIRAELIQFLDDARACVGADGVHFPEMIFEDGVQLLALAGIESEAPAHVPGDEIGDVVGVLDVVDEPVPEEVRGGHAADDDAAGQDERAGERHEQPAAAWFGKGLGRGGFGSFHGSTSC